MSQQHRPPKLSKAEQGEDAAKPFRRLLQYVFRAMKQDPEKFSAVANKSIDLFKNAGITL